MTIRLHGTPAECQAAADRLPDVFTVAAVSRPTPTASASSATTTSSAPAARPTTTPAASGNAPASAPASRPPTPAAPGPSPGAAPAAACAGAHTTHHDDAAHQRARRRYEGLRAKAASTGFPHEATACHAKAEQLRAKYGLL